MKTACSEIETFIERLPVGIVVLEADLRMMTCNNLALEILRVDVERCLMENFAEVVEDRRLKEALLLMREGKTRQQSHLVLASGDRIIACTIKAIPGDEGTHEFIITVEDATKLRDLERMKREFIGSLLHRLRGPLATLKTSLAMVRDERIGTLPSDIREILGMGHHEVNRLSVLLNDMRDLFQIETGLACKDLDLETFSMADVLDRAIAGLLKMNPSFDTVRQRLVHSGNLEVKVAADFDKTMRVLSILLKNAFQYSPDDSPIELSCIKKEGSANIRIHDSGEGIAKDKLPLVFTKFFREDTLYTRKAEGNGLGLFIAKSFSEQMGGTLFLESEAGKGTSCFLTLPLAERT
jgi:NtrC-family two-component system sensor histidine kinase KinB